MTDDDKKVKINRIRELFTKLFKLYDFKYEDFNTLYPIPKDKKVFQLFLF